MDNSKTTRHRLVFALQFVLICAFLTVIPFSRKEQWPNCVLYTNVMAWQVGRDAAKIDTSQEKITTEQEDPEYDVAYAPPPLLWMYRYLIALTFLITASSFIVSLYLLNKTPLSKYKKTTSIVTVLLSAVLVHLVFYSYSQVYKNKLLKRFSLTPEKTIILLQRSSGWDADPSRLIYCDPYVDPYSIIDATRSKRQWTSASLENYKASPLSETQMEEAIQLLISKDYFALGTHIGPWSWNDGSVFYISVYDGKEHTMVTGVDSGEAERLRLLYEELTELAKQSTHEW